MPESVFHIPEDRRGSLELIALVVQAREERIGSLRLAAERALEESRAELQERLRVLLRECQAPEVPEGAHLLAGFEDSTVKIITPEAKPEGPKLMPNAGKAKA